MLQYVLQKKKNKNISIECLSLSFTKDVHFIFHYFNPYSQLMTAKIQESIFLHGAWHSCCVCYLKKYMYNDE